MGNISRRAVRDFKRYTKPVKQETVYTINTSRGPVKVSKGIYEKLNNKSIKEIKKAYDTKAK